MAPQRVEHSKAKASAYQALQAAIMRAGLLCHALPDGMSVWVDDEMVYEPDALAYCGAEASEPAASSASTRRG
jgi:hypothetical protein